MRMQLCIKNEFGVYKSSIVDVNEEQYQKMLEVSRDFHKSMDSFNMDLDEDGGQLYIPPDIVKKSILIVKIVSD